MNRLKDVNIENSIELIGRRLLRNPDKKLIERVYGGSTERYRRCVIANFPGCNRPEKK